MAAPTALPLKTALRRRPFWDFPEMVGVFVNRGRGQAPSDIPQWCIY